jgi:hypothetical protein
MKTKFIRMTLLLLMPAMLFAQNGITITNFLMESGTATFDVQWTNVHPTGFVWSDTAWVFVDYNNASTMTRLPITNASVTNGSVIKIANNDKGVWVVGNARSAGEFSTTVTLFTEQPAVAGACAYAINYPPVGKYSNSKTIKFTGTPPFYLKYTNNTSATVTKAQAPNPYNLATTLASFTDMSGAPGSTYCAPALPPTMSGPSTACNSARVDASPGNAGAELRWSNGSTASYINTTSTGYVYAYTVTGPGCEAGNSKYVTIYTAGGNLASSQCGCQSGLQPCQSGVCRTSCKSYFKTTETLQNPHCTGGRFINSAAECSAYLSALHDDFAFGAILEKVNETKYKIAHCDTENGYYEAYTLIILAFKEDWACVTDL